MRYKVQFEIIKADGTPAAITVRPNVSAEENAVPMATTQVQAAFPGCEIKKTSKPEAIRI